MIVVWALVDSKLFEYFKLYIPGSLFGKGIMFIEWYKGQSKISVLKFALSRVKMYMLNYVKFDTGSNGFSVSKSAPVQSIILFSMRY